VAWVKRLSGELSCCLCQELILDAGVLPCSHGFCYKCVHGALAKRSECPACRGAVPPRTKPVRSMHVDNIVALVSERMDGPARARWGVREEGARAFWEGLGGEDLGREGAEQEEEEEARRRERKASAREARGSGKGVCEGCNEKGHSLEDCPHRSDREGDDEEDDEEEEEELEDEEDDGDSEY
jgi:hypothetical protein